MNYSHRLLAPLFLSVALSGCALTKDTIDISYAPSPVTTKAGSGRTASVLVQDARANRDAVSHKKNGYGMEMAPIVTREPVPAIVQRALEAELKARGFQIGTGGSTSVVELSRFYSNYEVGFWSSTAAGEVTLSIAVRGTGFSKTVTGTNRNSGEMLMGGSGAKEALELALKDAMHQLFADPAFVSALLKG